VQRQCAAIELAARNVTLLRSHRLRNPTRGLVDWFNIDVQGVDIQRAERPVRQQLPRVPCEPAAAKCSDDPVAKAGTRSRLTEDEQSHHPDWPLGAGNLNRQHDRRMIVEALLLAPDPVLGRFDRVARVALSGRPPRLLARSRGSLLRGPASSSVCLLGEQIFDLRVDAAQVVVGPAPERVEQGGGESK
jgi:hypothetical protein